MHQKNLEETELGSDILILFRGAFDNKIELWKNLSAIERAINVTVCEDKLEDAILNFALNPPVEASAQLSQDDLLAMFKSCVSRRESVQK
jgi:hypothetical protein